MKTFFYRSFTLLALIIGASSLQAGILFYVPIPASESDPNSGISEENTYTTAVDGGNARGTDRVVNGITLYALTGEGQSLSANNCSLSVLEGTVANGGGAAESIKADGTVSEVVSDMTFNNEANDGSEQDIVLDPESLEPGTTYDLRVYISNSSGQNREVNLKFFGDGQPAVETGWFNEDDATTAPGGFSDANQVYYIDYRYTWDGDTTPGVAISQRYGRTPFCLYALTNQIVPGGGEEVAAAAAGQEVATAGTGAERGAQGSAEEAPPAESGGLTEGYLAPTTDEVGVTSDTFYSDDSLNSNGEWVDVGGYGKCWRPTRVSVDWRPYTNGRWGHCDDCGWTWISEEDWGWCTYHYGRWIRTVDTGWCWVPGTVWAPAWVSWRRGTGSDCNCVGWAPLPPEAGCEIGVGIGNWVDYTCGLGPDAYTFVNVVDFGSDNFSRCGTCLIDRGRYVNIFEHTTNCTNTSYVNIVNQTNNKYVNIYNGGPDSKWVNGEIKKRGGKEVPQIHVNRYDDPTKIKGGKRSQLEGNTLTLAAPKITPTKNPQHAPKVAATIPKEKVDKGWAGVKDAKVKGDLEKKIAQQTKGQTPKSAPAKLPSEVASKLARKPVTTGHVKGLPKGAVVQQPGARGGVATQGRAKAGRPGERRTQKGVAGQPGATAGRPATGSPDARKGLAAPPKTQGAQGGKPGQTVGQKGRGKAGVATQGGAPATAQGAAHQGGIRPGQSLKKTGRAPAGVAGRQGPAQGPQTQAAKAGIQGKGAQRAQAQKPVQGAQVGGAPGTKPEGIAAPSTREQRGPGTQQKKAQGAGVTKGETGVQGARQPREAKPGQAAQAGTEREQPARKQQQQQQQAEERRKAAQQKQAEQQNVARQQQLGAQRKEAQQRQAEQQQKQRQQQQAEQQQKQRQQQQAEQQQRQRQQQQAQQQQKQRQQQQAEQQQKQRQQQQAEQQQRQRQQQQAQQQQRQLQQQQAQQQQRQLQQQQAQQRQRQLQQQQAQQQQRQPARGRPTPTPMPR